MLATTNRTQAIELLNVEHEAVRALIESLTPDEMTLPDTIRYGLYPGQNYLLKIC